MSLPPGLAIHSGVLQSGRVPLPQCLNQPSFVVVTVWLTVLVVVVTVSGSVIGEFALKGVQEYVFVTPDQLSM